MEVFGPDFEISPSEGYISPGMTVPFEVTFHPTELSQDIRYDVSQQINKVSKGRRNAILSCYLVLVLWLSLPTRQITSKESWV